MPEANDDGAELTASVIIAARNAAATITDQLAALAAQTYRGPWEIVVVDNASTDETLRVAAGFETHVPSLRVVREEGSVGSNYARNRGASVARGRFLLFSDSDDVVTEGWVEALVAGLEEADAVGGPVDLTSLNPDRVVAWRHPWPYEDFAVPAGFLPSPIGANCGVRRDVWQALGGFDERIAYGGAETEFFWRLQLAGYSLRFVPNAVVRYRLRPTARDLFAQQFRWGRAQARLLRRFKGSGAATPPGRPTLANCVLMLARVPDLIRSPESRTVWLRDAAWGVGLVAGHL